MRKIYEDGTRSLSIDNPNLINFPHCRMDLLFWHNISNKGEDKDMILENTTHKQFETVYNGHSLFHYFAKNVEVIEMIHDMFKDGVENGTISEDDTMPLTLLHPDPDGFTALDIACKEKRPKTFELMIDLLEPFNKFCLSKMLLSVFPHMIDESSDMIVKFFSSAVYQPTLMQEPIVLPWPEDFDEFKFASNTSLITPEVLMEELSKHMKLPEAPPKEDEVSEDVKNKNRKELRKNIRP
jgi:hypothetical protein